MSRRPVRWLTRLGVAAIAVAMTAAPALAAVSISPPDPANAGKTVGGNYSWNYGNSLDTSSCGGTDYLNAAYSTDFVGGTFAGDSGPYQSTFTTRRTPAGTTFSTPKKVSQAGVHTERPTLAADGSVVIAGFVSQVSYDAYDPAQKRVFYVRTSTDCGANFGAVVRVSPSGGRVDYPILAGAAGRFYAVWTDSNTGDIRFAVSINNGATWTQSIVGTTTSDAGDGEGKYAYPTVAASGMNVAVGWYKDNAGKQVVRGSSNGGASFGAETTISTSDANDTIHYMTGGGQKDGAGNRVAIAYTSGSATASKLAVRTWNGSAWSTEKTVITYGTNVGGLIFHGSYGPSPLPYGASGLQVAFPFCQEVATLANDCDYYSNKDRTSMWYEDSPAGTFADSAPRQIASSVQNRYLNDSATLARIGSTTYILYNGWTSNYFYYRLFLKTASGTGPS